MLKSRVQELELALKKAQQNREREELYAKKLLANCVNKIYFDMFLK